MHKARAFSQHNGTYNLEFWRCKDDFQAQHCQTRKFKAM